MMQFSFIDPVLRAETWRADWPQHCRSCGGWGDHEYERVGLPIMVEPRIARECDSTDPHRCHRCGMPGLDEDSNGPCGSCGWDYDDGDPSLR